MFAPALLAMPFVLIMQLLLLLSGDVETNPGPLGQHTEGRRLLSFRHVDAMYSLSADMIICAINPFNQRKLRIRKQTNKINK